MPVVSCAVRTKCLRPSLLPYFFQKPHPLFIALLLLLFGLGQTVAMAPDRCLGPRPEAMCSVAGRSYYYDAEEMKCLSIFWSCPDEWVGNSFPTLEECQAICLSSAIESTSETTPTTSSIEPVTMETTMATSTPAVDVCLQPFHNPYCMFYLPGQWPQRFYYRSADQRCVSVMSFGCGTSPNDFATEEECIATCIATVEETTPTPTSTLPTSSSSSTSHMTDHMTSSGDHMTPGTDHTSTGVVPSSISMATASTPSPSNYPTVMTSSLEHTTGTEPETTTTGTEPETTTTGIEPDTTTTGTESETTTAGEERSPGSSRIVLSVFDFASIAIGLVAFLLILILLGLLAMVSCRYRRRQQQNNCSCPHHQQQMKTSSLYIDYCSKKRVCCHDNKVPAMQKNCCYDNSGRTCFSKPSLA